MPEWMKDWPKQECNLRRTTMVAVFPTLLIKTMHAILLRRIYYMLPPQLRLLGRRLFYFPIDALEALSGRKKLIPPRGLIFTGSGDFEEVGQKFLDYFKQFAGLRPDCYVLDVGCGIGRMAVALTGYLNTAARYDGFDIVKQGIAWCQKRISTQYPNFCFRHVELGNDLYSTSQQKADNFTFPYPDHAYDLVIVISVFTHMTRAELTHYLSEMHRTLKTDGVVFATFFLLNGISRGKMRHQTFKFDYSGDGCYLMDPHVQSANVAYDETELDSLLTTSGFSVRHRLYGNWSGRTEGITDFQDILVLKKV